MLGSELERPVSFPRVSRGRPSGQAAPSTPQNRFPSPKLAQQQSDIHVAKLTLEVAEPSKRGQGREEGGASYLGQCRALARGCSCAQYLPLVPGRAWQHFLEGPRRVSMWSTTLLPSRPRSDQPACLHPTACNRRLCWDFPFNVGLWKTQGGLKSTQIPPP